MLDYRFVAQIVISIGSNELSRVVEAIKTIIRDSKYRIDVTTARTALELDPTPTDDDLASTAAKLSSRSITSACLHPALNRPIAFIHLFAPNFCESSLSVWQGVIEYKEIGFQPIFDKLLQKEGLLYVCVGMEEGPELDDRHLHVDTFPFDEEPLMISAFRRTEGCANEWEIRRGPAYPA